MKLLVAYDSSAASEKALELAKKRALQLNASIYVVTSLVGANETPMEDIEAANQGLDHAREIVAEAGVPVETHLLVRGMSPGEDVVQFCEEIGADEIIIGTRRKSKVGKFLFGSTAQFIILRSRCPVLTVNRDADLPQG